MKYTQLLATAFILLITTVCTAQKPYPTMGRVVYDDPGLEKLIPKSSSIEVLASGFIWTEGPVWVKDSACLLFSDAPQNTIFSWSEKEGIKPFLKPAGYTGRGKYSREPGSNGLIIDQQGRLVACEHGDRRISAMPLTGGGKITLADKFEGKRFNSPNDIVQHPTNSSFYFTDPPYGLPGYDKDPTREVDFFGVYRIAPDGKVSLVSKDLTRPNGIAISPDGKTLYVAQSDSQRAIWTTYPILKDGSTGPGRVFFDATAMGKSGLRGGPDGMKIDQEGNLWATGPGGILVITPEGKLLGRIETGQATANCAWGDDGSTLYITAHTYICRIKTSTMGSIQPGKTNK